MLVIERGWAELLSTPVLVRIGIAVMFFGGLSDVVAHLGAPGDVGATGHHDGALSAHLIGFAGMVLVQAGVVLDGARRSRARRKAGDSHKGVA